MTTTPTVTQQPLSDRLKKKQRSDRRDQVFQVLAADGDAALAELSRVKGVAYDVVYRDDHGVADDRLRAREFEVQPTSVAPVGGRRLHRVAVHYRPRPPKTNGSQPEKDESRAGAIYVWGISEEQVEFEKDLDGKAVANSRDELYGAGLSVLRPSRTLSIRWYERFPNVSDMIRYDGVANSDAWRIRGRYRVEKGQVLSAGIVPADEDDEWSLVTWELRFRSRGLLWEPYQIPDYAIEDGKRVLLDGEGGVLEEGEDPVIREHRAYYLEPFGVWGV